MPGSMVALRRRGTVLFGSGASFVEDAETPGAAASGLLGQSPRARETVEAMGYAGSEP